MILIFVSGLVCLAVSGVTAVPLTGCTNKPADIVFILDSSNSIWLNDFRKQTRFVANVVKNFDIGQGPTQTRVGILLFGHDVWPEIQLNNNYDVNGLVKAVEKIDHRRGRWTKTGKAIDTAVKTMFTDDDRSRVGVSRIAVVITDGRSQNVIETREAAKLAHDSGIKTFALGVGRRLDYQELADIASDPDDEYLYTVDNFNALNKTLVQKLASRACDVTERTPTIIPVPVTTEPTNIPSDQSLKNCGGKPADVFFVIDSSGSITSKDFNKELQFVQSVVKLFDISNDKTRVGIINFSHMSQMILPLENSLDKRQLLSKIRNIDHIGGGTTTSEALKMIRQDGFRRDNNRPGVVKIAIVLTDGLSANEDLTRREALLTHAAGIKVFAIGIGDGIDLLEIQNIASNPDDNYVFQVNDFNSLETIKDLLAIKTCSAKPDENKEIPNDQPRCLVKRNTDMMFVYDSSALGPKKSEAISMFIATIVSNLDISSKHLHIGRITDNCPSGGNFQLSNRLSAADFTSIGVSTFSDLINKVKRTGFSSEYGGRSDSSKSSILFIDSDMNSVDGSALRAAKDLSTSSDVFVVAIGNSPTIRDFSRTFHGNKFLHVNSYNDLPSTSNNFLNQLCYFITLNSFDYSLDYVDYVIPV
ncbi:cartilage matrix protein-like [Ruditapes philippinarum]|uniref:cartilage matrix protein-like n=1 Tax=Ruditapes philippinarum TaxID=129788 RepID=UPI00295B42F6|nr:cartilage matrix protein-like [Ruditapes philippinarum]